MKTGVPESLFSTRVVDQFGMPKGMAIKATRVAGDGSTLARLMGLDELAPYVSEFGPKGRQLYLKRACDGGLRTRLRGSVSRGF